MSRRANASRKSLEQKAIQLVVACLKRAHERPGTLVLVGLRAVGDAVQAVAVATDDASDVELVRELRAALEMHAGTVPPGADDAGDEPVH